MCVLACCRDSDAEASGSSADELPLARASDDETQQPVELSSDDDAADSGGGRGTSGSDQSDGEGGSAGGRRAAGRFSSDDDGEDAAGALELMESSVAAMNGTAGSDEGSSEEEQENEQEDSPGQGENKVGCCWEPSPARLVAWYPDRDAVQALDALEGET